jgi:hypothetical protein
MHVRLWTVRTVPHACATGLTDNTHDAHYVHIMPKVIGDGGGMVAGAAKSNGGVLAWCCAKHMRVMYNQGIPGKQALLLWPRPQGPRSTSRKEHALVGVCITDCQ